MHAEFPVTQLFLGEETVAAAAAAAADDDDDDADDDDVTAQCLCNEAKEVEAPEGAQMA